LDGVEVHYESDRDVHEFHVTQELRLVDVFDAFDGLEFEKQAIFDKQITAKGLLEGKVLVGDFHRLLVRASRAPEVEFVREAFLIDRFEQPRAKRPVNINRRADGAATERVGLFV
jgi:hypothetical protein